MKNEIKGKLEVICGSMFSGKSEELLYRLRRAEYAKKQVLTIKPAIDNRKSVSCIVCHSGGRREALPVGSCEESLKKIMSLANETIDVVGIDEIQFFPSQTVAVVSHLLDRGKRVILAGLDLDFRGEPFGIMPTLLALADEVVKLRAICMGCGSEANFSQRLINGAPARRDDPTILVGGEECYEARCRQCFEIDTKAFTAFSKEGLNL